MKKNLFQEMMLSSVLIYLGVIVLIIPYFLDFDLYPTLEGMGLSSIFLGFFNLFYNRICRKIDSISSNISNLHRSGIDQIIPADLNSYEDLRRSIKKSSKVQIAINVYRLTDESRYFLNSLLENDTTKFQIVFLGKTSNFKTRFFIEDLHKKEANNVSIKTLTDIQMDNLVIIDGKPCILHYNDFDNKLSFFIVYVNSDVHYYKSKKLFDFLWDQGTSFLDSEGWE